MNAFKAEEWALFMVTQVNNTDQFYSTTMYNYIGTILTAK